MKWNEWWSESPRISYTKSLDLPAYMWRTLILFVSCFYPQERHFVYTQLLSFRIDTTRELRHWSSVRANPRSIWRTVSLDPHSSAFSPLCFPSQQNRTDLVPPDTFWTHTCGSRVCSSASNYGCYDLSGWGVQNLLGTDICSHYRVKSISLWLGISPTMMRKQP